MLEYDCIYFEYVFQIVAQFGTRVRNDNNCKMLTYHFIWFFQF